jgi:hypothetical protein
MAILLIVLGALSVVLTEQNPRELNAFLIGTVTSVGIMALIYPVLWASHRQIGVAQPRLSTYFMYASREHKLAATIFSVWFAIGCGMASMNYHRGELGNKISFIIGLATPIIFMVSVLLLIALFVWIFSGFISKQ